MNLYDGFDVFFFDFVIFSQQLSWKERTSVSFPGIFPESFDGGYPTKVTNHQHQPGQTRVGELIFFPQKELAQHDHPSPKKQYPT